MLSFTLSAVVLLLLSANAAPTALLPKSATLDTAGQIVEARADITAPRSCEAKAAWALGEYKRVDKQCDDWGIKAFFSSECWYGKPRELLS